MSDYLVLDTRLLRSSSRRKNVKHESVATTQHYLRLLLLLNWRHARSLRASLALTYYWLLGVVCMHTGLYAAYQYMYVVHNCRTPQRHTTQHSALLSNNSTLQMENLRTRI